MSETATIARPAVPQPLPENIDLSPLRRYWHPVAVESDLAEDRPLAVTLLGESLVLFRSNGSVTACADLCLHRGAKISRGWVRDGRIVCPYHGFNYDGTGQCVYIPSQARDRQRIPARLKLVRYEAAVRYGLIWVALEDPVQPLPEYPEFGDPGYRTHFGFSVSWDASAARVTENSLDITHFPFVHPGKLGEPEHPELPEFNVERTATGLQYEYDWALPGEGGHLGAEVHFEYHLTIPFTMRLRIHGEEGTTILFGGVCPRTADTISKWVFFSRNHSLDEPDDRWRDFSKAVYEEDRQVLESQRPEMLPVDLTKEVHLRAGDAPGIAYRAIFEQIGVQYA